MSVCLSGLIHAACVLAVIGALYWRIYKEAN